MRKTLLTIFAAMLTTVSTSAADISLQSAKTLAAQYVTVPQVQRAKSNTSGGTATDKLLNHFYCFNDASGKGFVLISDDDCVQPVLGYSDSGAFDVDHVPVQLQDWLTAVSQYISQNKAAGKAVAALKVKGTPVVAPLVTTKWDQRAPYNAMTPIAGSLTGCVATAMAQIMNYHKWPVKGQGSRTYTSYCYDDLANATYTTKEISMDFSQSVYDYANMLDEYHTTKDGNQWNAAQAAAVSKLMLDCGVAASMSYGVTGSDACDQDAAYGLSEYFGYNTEYYWHDMMSTPDFLKVIKDELDGGYPLYFGGYSSTNGHGFVVDGYDSNGFLHANMGASGWYDGYYDICDMNGFYSMQSCITAHPNRTGVKSDFIFATAIQKYHPDVFHHGGKDIINEPIDSFTVTLDSLYIYSDSDYEGYQALALYQGKRLVELLDTADVSLHRITMYDGKEQYTYSDSLTLNVRKASIDTLADGAYTLVPVSFGKKQLQSGTALSAADIAVSILATRRTLSMEINNGKMTVCCVASSDFIDLKCEFARDTTYRAGLYDMLSIPVKIQNKSNTVKPTLLATLTKADNTECDTIFYDNYVVYDHYTRVFDIDYYVSSPSEVGRYVYALGYYEDDGKYVPLITPADSVMVEIYADSTCEKPTLTATLDYVSDADNADRILDMDNLRTGGTDNPSVAQFHYHIKYTGKTNIPYDYRIMVNDSILNYQSMLTYELTDTVYSPGVNLLRRATMYGSFKLSLEYKLPDDTEWQPLDKNHPCFFITSDIPTGISVPSATESTDSDDNAPYYTLQGIRLSARPTSPGLYIRKGKTVVVK